jgi:hypothetical protein
VIQPQARFDLLFDPPLSTASHAVTVYYLQRPVPVFHNYGAYRFSVNYADALIAYAAAKYKLADKEPDYFSTFKKEWYNRLGEINKSAGTTFNRGGFKMSMRGVR